MEIIKIKKNMWQQLKRVMLLKKDFNKLNE